MRDYSKNDWKSLVIIKYLEEKEIFANIQIFLKQTDTQGNVAGH